MTELPPSGRELYDAVVIGSGPNGLAAAITLAERGRSILLVEGGDTVGGGMRSAELTLPGFTHDVCSSVHPLGLASPFFAGLPQPDLGLVWEHPEAPLAHPLDDGTAVVLERSVTATAQGLGADAATYRRLMEPLVSTAQELMAGILGPLRPPRHPFAMARFALSGLRSVHRLGNDRFSGERAKALLAGVAAHSMLPLTDAPTAAYGLVLALLAHAVGWPVARGGSQRIADAMATHLEGLGGKIETGRWVRDIDELPASKTVLFDVTPRQLLTIAGHRLPRRYRRTLGRFRYGPGVFKMDFALDGPVPWRAPECARAGTVHLGGTLAQITESEEAVHRNRHPDRPFVLVVQASAADPTRAPAGRHTLWAYCHVPMGSDRDMSAAIEAEIERHAPGFRDRVLMRAVRGPQALEAYNPNNVGGDINGGIQDLRQLFSRPAWRPVPYTTPNPAILLCSSSTPPGGGVHGMCGVFAARAALAGALG